jgi:hypothetical protein
MFYSLHLSQNVPGQSGPDGVVVPQDMLRQGRARINAFHAGLSGGVQAISVLA